LIAINKSIAFRRAFRATTAHRLNEQVEIFSAIVVSDLVSWRDCPNGTQEDPVIHQRALGIRPAGMIGVAADVGADRAVDGPAPVDLEHVAASGAGFARVCLLRGNAAAGVLDDELALGDRGGRKETKAGRGAAHAIALTSSRFFC
jgi:hypothetical protein